MTKTISRYDLELRLLWLNNKLRELNERHEKLLKEMLDFCGLLLQLRAETQFTKVAEMYTELMKMQVKNIIPSIVAENLNLNVNVKPDELGKDDRAIGSVLVEYEGSTKPAIIYITKDYEVWYKIIGEPHE
jgi:hypothetical protein